MLTSTHLLRTRTGFNTRTHSTVRTAMVSLMLAAGPEVGEVEPPPLAQAFEGASYLVEGVGQPKRGWHEAEPAEGGRTRPRDASTCLLWSAIALGALVRGCPLEKVGAAESPPCWCGNRARLIHHHRCQRAETRVENLSSVVERGDNVSGI